MSCCSVLKRITLVNKDIEPKSQMKLDNRRLYLSVKGELLDSQRRFRSGLVIFSIMIIAKSPSIQFESDNVLIYIYESDSLVSSKIAITGNNLTDELLPVKKRHKFQVSGPIYQSNIIENKNIKKIGLKLPPIMFGDEKLDFGIIDFELR